MSKVFYIVSVTDDLGGEKMEGGLEGRVHISETDVLEDYVRAAFSEGDSVGMRAMWYDRNEIVEAGWNIDDIEAAIDEGRVLDVSEAIGGLIHFEEWEFDDIDTWESEYWRAFREDYEGTE